MLLLTILKHTKKEWRGMLFHIQIEMIQFDWFVVSHFIWWNSILLKQIQNIWSNCFGIVSFTLNTISGCKLFIARNLLSFPFISATCHIRWICARISNDHVNTIISIWFTAWNDNQFYKNFHAISWKWFCVREEELSVVLRRFTDGDSIENDKSLFACPAA